MLLKGSDNVKSMYIQGMSIKYVYFLNISKLVYDN